MTAPTRLFPEDAGVQFIQTVIETACMDGEREILKKNTRRTGYSVYGTKIPTDVFHAGLR